MSITNQIVQQAPGGPAGRHPGADLARSTFENVDLSLFELFRASIGAGSVVIEGKTFTNCRIEGPAVMLPLSGVVFDATNFGYNAGDMRNLVLRPASQSQVIGAIAVRDCRFINCEFFAVGFTGAEDFLQSIIALESRDAAPR